jgi:hypothetical protein
MKAKATAVGPSSAPASDLPSDGGAGAKKRILMAMFVRPKQTQRRTRVLRINPPLRCEGF